MAAVLVVLIISRHRRWADEKATKAAEEATRHHHVWGMWEFRRSTTIYSSRNPGGRPVDNHHQYARRCETCGDVEIKTLNDSGAYVP